MNCEECGMELTEDNTYVRTIRGKDRLFGCSHCADGFEKRAASVPR